MGDSRIVIDGMYLQCGTRFFIIRYFLAKINFVAKIDFLANICHVVL
jgi:hypothetical protein